MNCQWTRVDLTENPTGVEISNKTFPLLRLEGPGIVGPLVELLDPVERRRDNSILDRVLIPDTLARGRTNRRNTDSSETLGCPPSQKLGYHLAAEQLHRSGIHEVQEKVSHTELLGARANLGLHLLDRPAQHLR